MVDDRPSFFCAPSPSPPFKGFSGATNGDERRPVDLEVAGENCNLSKYFEYALQYGPLWTTRIFHPDTSHNTLTLGQVIQN